MKSQPQAQTRPTRARLGQSTHRDRAAVLGERAVARDLHPWVAFAITVLVCSFGLSFLGTARSSAAVPPLFWNTPEDGVAGGEAGRLHFPIGIGVAKDTGHLFVADAGNHRIVEMNAWGEFVKAWGWGVVASGPDNQAPHNERQKLTVAASAGTYRMVFFNVSEDGQTRKQTTTDIGFNWPASDPGTPGVVDSVQEALEALPSLAAHPGSVLVAGGPGDAGGSSPYTIEFVGDYADTDVPPFNVQSALAGSATVATLQTGGSFEICIPNNGDVCQAGQQGGSSPGAIPAPSGGVAVDPQDNVYVYESQSSNLGEGPNFRVQKFAPSGEFLAMWGGEVNKTKSAEVGRTEAERNLCTKAQVESGDVCGRGVPICPDVQAESEGGCTEESGLVHGQFKQPPSRHPGSRIVVGPTGSVYVGDIGRIQEFTPDGVFSGETNVPGEGIQSLAMDGAGNFYATYYAESNITEIKSNVRKLNSAGVEIGAFAASTPTTVAVDGEGNVYIIDHAGTLPGLQDKILEYSEGGVPLVVADDHWAEGEGVTILGGLATGEACSLPGPDIYVSNSTGSFVSAYGPVPQDLVNCPPPVAPPAVREQFVSAAEATSASVRALINPRFWADTRYFVEYGTGRCSEGGCTSTVPAPPGQLLTDEVVKQPLATSAVVLPGLAPQTTYHYRFVAQSSGGGPVYGVDPDGSGPESATASAGLEGTFRTRPVLASPPDACPNAGFRTGASAFLSDCRAFEMVSPVEKENGDIFVLEKPGDAHAPMSLNQAAPDGNRLTYSSYRAFGDAVSAPISSTYMASRGPSGWNTAGISPPRGQNLWEVAESLDIQYKAFTADLCTGLLVHETVPPLTADAPSGFADIYERNNCGSDAGTYRSLIDTPPPVIEPKRYFPDPQGMSADGSQVVFRSRDQLTEDAFPCNNPAGGGACPYQLYESTSAGIRLVCIRPDGTSAKGCSAGTATGESQNDNRSHTVAHAVSADGSRIFWSDKDQGRGRIYVRIDGNLTKPVSEAGETQSGALEPGSQFWDAADDGSAAIYSVGGYQNGNADLYRYVVGTETTTKIAGRVSGVAGISADARRIYLVSKEDLDAGATAGQPNLYLYEYGEPGSFSFIATLAARDVSVNVDGAFDPVAAIPKNHTAQVTPSGSSIVFTSLAPITGYENIDTDTGERALEVYMFDAGSSLTRCLSCNTTGARPGTEDMGGGIPYQVAAMIPPWQNQMYRSPSVISSSGNRVFFESFDSLIATDTNGAKDVYEWERPGEGPPEARCQEGSPTFVDAAGGCITLVSSGISDQGSSFVDSTPSGNDVFIATSQSLLPQDPGLIDIYDARVGGGFPAPPPPNPECDVCQNPGAAPGETTPGSLSFRGPGNPSQKTVRKCPKGKKLVRRHGKPHCMPKHQHHPRRKHHHGKHDHKHAGHDMGSHR